MSTPRPNFSLVLLAALCLAHFGLGQMYALPSRGLDVASMLSACSGTVKNVGPAVRTPDFGAYLSMLAQELKATGGTIRLLEGAYQIRSSINLPENVCLEGANSDGSRKALSELYWMSRWTETRHDRALNAGVVIMVQNGGKRPTAVVGVDVVGQGHAHVGISVYNSKDVALRYNLVRDAVNNGMRIVGGQRVAVQECAVRGSGDAGIFVHSTSQFSLKWASVKGPGTGIYAAGMATGGNIEGCRIRQDGGKAPSALIVDGMKIAVYRNTVKAHSVGIEVKNGAYIDVVNNNIMTKSLDGFKCVQIASKVQYTFAGNICPASSTSPMDSVPIGTFCVKGKVRAFGGKRVCCPIDGSCQAVSNNCWFSIAPCVLSA